MDKKDLSDEKKCSSCGVPEQFHNTVCGWHNASFPIFPWEKYVPAAMTGEEKMERWEAVKAYFSQFKHPSELTDALKVCYDSLQTYGSHPIIERQVEKALSNGNIYFGFPVCRAIGLLEGVKSGIAYEDFNKDGVIKTLSEVIAILEKTPLKDKEKKSRCCGRCDGVNDICVTDMVCEDHNTRGCETCYGPREVLHPAISHINATPEFLANPKSIEMLNKMVSRALFATKTKDESIYPKEFIICAANYYNDKLVHDPQPVNIQEGFVTCGYRHRDCNAMFSRMRGVPYSAETELIDNIVVKGFLTSFYRFVDRKEAYAIAFKANQIIGPNKGYPENEIGLTSEDLY